MGCCLMIDHWAGTGSCISQLSLGCVAIIKRPRNLNIHNNKSLLLIHDVSVEPFPYLLHVGNQKERLVPVQGIVTVEGRWGNENE